MSHSCFVGHWNYVETTHNVQNKYLCSCHFVLGIRQQNPFSYNSVSWVRKISRNWYLRTLLDVQFIENFHVLTSTTIIKYIASFREYGYCYGLVHGQIIFFFKTKRKRGQGMDITQNDQWPLIEVMSKPKLRGGEMFWGSLIETVGNPPIINLPLVFVITHLIEIFLWKKQKVNSVTVTICLHELTRLIVEESNITLQEKLQINILNE